MLFKKRNDEEWEDDLDEIPEELPEEETDREKGKKLPKKKSKAANIVGAILNGLFGFGLATAIVLGIACLGVEFILTKGPSESLRNMFVMTILETRRFDFICNIFLTEEEIAEIKAGSNAVVTQVMDTSLISIAAKDENVEVVDETGKDAYGLVDDDGDGVIFTQVKGRGYLGYMIVVLDPTRVFVGMPDFYGGNGLTLAQLCEKYGAIGGINAGGFKDDGGGGSGGNPEGLTIIDGVYYNAGSGESAFAGLDTNGILHVGYYSEWLAQRDNIINGVSFGPPLIINGQAVELEASGVNPRTAIAQRADGAIMMLVIDGRQVQSLGATYQDVIDLLLGYGAVNACNMDGGSSTCMYYEGRYINSSSSAAGERMLPNAFLVK